MPVKQKFQDLLAGLGRRTNIGQFFEEFHRFVTGQGDERTDIRDGVRVGRHIQRRREPFDLIQRGQIGAHIVQERHQMLF